MLINIDKEGLDVRTCSVCGTFYSRSELMLKSQLDSFFNNSKIEYEGQNIKAMIVPHAGFVYSGQIAMNAYKQLYFDLLLRENDFYKIIILAPSHQEYFKGYSIAPVNYFKTPLGKIKLIESKLNDSNYSSLQEKEHSIEVQLPFLQYIFKKANKDFEILPILLGDLSSTQRKEFITDLKKEITDNTIIIVSSDLSHYLEYNQAKKIDKKSIDQILTLGTEIDACGKEGIFILNDIFGDLDKKELDYKNSGDVVFDKTSVVGYTSIIYYNKENVLLKIARRSILDNLKKEKTNFNDLKENINKKFLEKKGTFVTLTINNQLRGCIGTIVSNRSIFDNIIENSKSAAFFDPRFNSLTEKEYKEVEVEISVLSKPEKTTLKEINFGEGVILKKGLKQAVYLPQVWEQLPNKEKFLSSLCNKAGLNNECYLDTKVIFEKFIVEIIK
jgi:MEMO1 family protein